MTPPNCPKERELNKTELFCGKRGSAALPTKKFWV